MLVLYGIYGYTHEEAANMLGIAVGTCKAQLHRARRLLRERLSVMSPYEGRTPQRRAGQQWRRPPEGAVRELPQSIEPRRDLWPQIARAARH